MQVDFSGISYDSQWFDYEGEKDAFKIRPYPQSMEKVTVKGPSSFELNERNVCDKFVYCCEDWKLKDRTGKPIPCTNKNKEKLYDFAAKINAEEKIRFVIDTADKMRAGKLDSEKNL